MDKQIVCELNLMAMLSSYDSMLLAANSMDLQFNYKQNSSQYHNVERHIWTNDINHNSNRNALISIKSNRLSNHLQHCNLPFINKQMFVKNSLSNSVPSTNDNNMVKLMTKSSSSMENANPSSSSLCASLNPRTTTNKQNVNNMNMSSTNNSKSIKNDTLLDRKAFISLEKSINWQSLLLKDQQHGHLNGTYGTQQSNNLSKRDQNLTNPLTDCKNNKKNGIGCKNGRCEPSTNVVDMANSSSIEFSLPGMKYVPSWLKLLRLHKYAPIFAHMSYEEMMNLTEDDLERKNITKGARQKLYLSIQKLKARSAVLLASEQQLLHWQNGTYRKNITYSMLSQVLFQIRAFLSTPIRASILANDEDGVQIDHSMMTQYSVVDVNNNNNPATNSTLSPSRMSRTSNQYETMAHAWSTLASYNDLPTIIVRLVGHVINVLIIKNKKLLKRSNLWQDYFQELYDNLSILDRFFELNKDSRNNGCSNRIDDQVVEDHEQDHDDGDDNHQAQNQTQQDDQDDDVNGVDSDVDADEVVVIEEYIHSSSSLDDSDKENQDDFHHQHSGAVVVSNQSSSTSPTGTSNAFKQEQQPQTTTTTKLTKNLSNEIIIENNHKNNILMANNGLNEYCQQQENTMKNNIDKELFNMMKKILDKCSVHEAFLPHQSLLFQWIEHLEYLLFALKSSSVVMDDDDDDDDHHQCNNATSNTVPIMKTTTNANGQYYNLNNNNNTMNNATTTTPIHYQIDQHQCLTMSMPSSPNAAITSTTTSSSSLSCHVNYNNNKSDPFNDVFGFISQSFKSPLSSSYNHNQSWTKCSSALAATTNTVTNNYHHSIAHRKMLPPTTWSSSTSPSWNNNHHQITNLTQSITPLTSTATMSRRLLSNNKSMTKNHHHNHYNNNHGHHRTNYKYYNHHHNQYQQRNSPKMLNMIDNNISSRSSTCSWFGDPLENHNGYDNNSMISNSAYLNMFNLQLNQTSTSQPSNNNQQISVISKVPADVRPGSMLFQNNNNNSPSEFNFNNNFSTSFSKQSSSTEINLKNLLLQQLITAQQQQQQYHSNASSSSSSYAQASATSSNISSLSSSPSSSSSSTSSQPNVEVCFVDCPKSPPFSSSSSSSSTPLDNKKSHSSSSEASMIKNGGDVSVLATSASTNYHSSSRNNNKLSDRESLALSSFHDSYLKLFESCPTTARSDEWIKNDCRLSSPSSSSSSNNVNDAFLLEYIDWNMFVTSDLNKTSTTTQSLLFDNSNIFNGGNSASAVTADHHQHYLLDDNFNGDSKLFQSLSLPFNDLQSPTTTNHGISLVTNQNTTTSTVTFDDIEQLSIRIAEHALEING